MASCSVLGRQLTGKTHKPIGATTPMGLVLCCSGDDGRRNTSYSDIIIVDLSTLIFTDYEIRPRELVKAYSFIKGSTRVSSPSRFRFRVKELTCLSTPNPYPRIVSCVSVVVGSSESFGIRTEASSLDVVGSTVLGIRSQYHSISLDFYYLVVNIRGTTIYCSCPIATISRVRKSTRT